MNKYGQTAVGAVQLIHQGKHPGEAWDMAALKIFGVTTSKDKQCPRNTFLGLCENGIISDVKRGNYTGSDLNKEYGLKAIFALKKIDDPKLISPNELWNLIQNGNDIAHNSQMDVVLALWNNNLTIYNKKSNLFFGTPPGIEEGDWFGGRKELIDAFLHRSTQHGIDGNGTEGVAAIVLSGGYEDDRDFGDEIIYTGHGGNKEGVQVEHQSWDAHGNKGLVVSKEKKLLVRVIRGYNHNSPFSPKSGYKYSGLYKVIDAWDEIGRSGFKICRFKLIKSNNENDIKDISVKEGCLIKLEPTGKEAKWFSIGVSAPNAQKLSEESVMAKKLIGSKVNDVIGFGSGFKVLEIKKYQSK